MTLSEWLESGLSGKRYVVMDGGLAPTAVADFYSSDGGNAIPLFAGTSFEDQLESGPWLLPDPSTEFVAAHPSPAGFGVISDQPTESVHRHWQSLIEAVREGEAVWFRFSDPRVLLPMLNAMTPDELDSVLGPCTGLWVNGEIFMRTPDAKFQPASQIPWLHIRAHHLAAIYDENRHAYILRRHFWQTMTGMMELHQDPKDAILPVLKAANLASLQGDVLDGVVAGALTLQAGLPLDGIRSPLMLTDDEMSQVANWLHKYQAKTGVS